MNYFYLASWVIILKPFKLCIKVVYVNTYKITSVESIYWKH